MTKYVIGPDVAMRLALDRAVIRADHQLFAPTLLRSQTLSFLYQAVRRGEMTKKDADEQLNYMRGLRIRLLGDRVLHNVAWKDDRRQTCVSARLEARDRPGDARPAGSR